MNQRKKTVLGFYCPSFIRLHVSTKKNLENLSNLPDLDASIFIHEYSHYIQDVTTTYGLSNICITVDYMKFVNNKVIKSNKNKFKVPVEPVHNGQDNVYTNLELSNTYWGTGEDDKAILNSYSLKRVLVNSFAGDLPVNIIEVTYTDANRQKKTFNFGGICIMESMAYIIEKNCYTDCQPSPDLPYCAAEKLVDLIYPAFGIDVLNILALCDASLQIYNPAEGFFEILNYFKDNNIIPENPEDVYEIFEKRYEFTQILIHTHKLAIQQIGDYFNDKHFLPIKNWLQNMIKLSVDFRLQNPYFILDIARGGKIPMNVHFIDFFKSVGTPLIINDLSEVTIYDPRNIDNEFNYGLIWAINQIHNIFWGGQKRCEMQAFCESSGAQIDARCEKEPWKRSSDEQLCSFGQIWSHWGLSGYYPK